MLDAASDHDQLTRLNVGAYLDRQTRQPLKPIVLMLYGQVSNWHVLALVGHRSNILDDFPSRSQSSLRCWQRHAATYRLR